MAPRPPSNLRLLWSFFWHPRVRGGAARLVPVLLLVFALWIGLETLLAPWIRSFGLWSTLTGEWHGELQMPDGRVTRVYFDIDGTLGRRGTRILGSARWCEAGDRIRDYQIGGDADNWRGTRFHLYAIARDERETGLSLGELQGERREDEIRAIGALVPRGGPVSAAATATRTERSVDQAPPTGRYILRRGREDEFLAACRRGR